MITISVFNVSAVVIDVSSHDGLIDWNRIEEHIEGVIIRIGYGNDIEGQDDKQAIRNMNECERLGIPYGVYIYSYALTSDEVTSEINHTLRMLQGRSPVRGVWFDMEDADGYKESNGLDVYKDGELLTDFCIQFIEAMDKEGYTTGVYANYNYYKNVLNLERLANTRGFNMWLAHWGIEEPGMDCMMWQFGAYLIDGHEFDGNIFYADYSSPFKDRLDTDDNGEDIERIDKAAGSSAIEAVNVDTNVNVIYRAQIRGSYWLPEVVNDEDYAGIQGTGITGVTLSTDKGYAVYRVYAGGRWLSYVDSRNSDINDYYNGYAGNGAEIEAVEVYYYTPASLLINEATPYASLKDGRYHYIETGSLISIKKNVKNILIPSEEMKLQVYPMDYEEFLWAAGSDSNVFHDICRLDEKMGNLINRKLMRDFRLYMAVGGMPQAVETYIATNNFDDVDRVKRQIIELYLEDLNRMDKSGKLAKIYKAIPVQLALKKKHFILQLLFQSLSFKPIAPHCYCQNNSAGIS